MTISARSRHSSPRGCHHRYTLTRIFAARRLPPSQMSVNERNPVPVVTTGTLNRLLLLLSIIAGLVGLNVALAVISPGILVPQDWWGYEQLPARIADGNVYDTGPGYWWVWPPIAAAIFAWMIVPIGYPIWFALHLAVLALMRSWWLIGLTALSLPFWIDTVVGHTTIFVAVAGVLALRGSRWGTLASLGLFWLAPRPLQLPLMAWLLWRQPGTLVPFVAFAAIAIVTTLVSGYSDEMLAAMTSIQSQQMALNVNLSPTHWIGPAWLVVGIPLAAWLTWKGRIGLAGLALTPYILPSYWLVLLWELDRPPRSFSRSAPTSCSAQGRG